VFLHSLYYGYRLSAAEATARILAGAKKETSLSTCWRCRMKEVLPKPEDKEWG